MKFRLGCCSLILASSLLVFSSLAIVSPAHAFNPPIINPNLSCTPPSGFKPLRTEGDLFNILNDYSNGVNANSYYLCNSITLTKIWNPLRGVFTGKFYGNGQFLSNLLVFGSSTIAGTGFFEEIGVSAEVRDLTFSAAQVSGGDEVGALAGRSAGLLDRVFVFNSAAAAPLSQITGRSSVGALVGRAKQGSIIRNSFVGKGIRVSATEANAGGLVGQGTGLIEGSENQGAEVQGKETVGGIIGTSYTSAGSGEKLVRNCRNYGAVTASDVRAGGIVGFATIPLEDSFNYGNVAGIKVVGGLVGRLDSHIVRSTNFGKVSGTVNVGGIVGNYLAGNIQDCKVTNALVQGLGESINIGGVAGWMNNAASVIQSANVSGSQISGAHQVGGVVGDLALGTVRGTFVDSDIYLTAADLWRTRGGLTGLPTSAGILEGNSFIQLRFTANASCILPAGFKAITTEEQLSAIASDYVNGENSTQYALCKSIVLTKAWTPLLGIFSGTFHGNGRHISALRITATTTNRVGFFEQLGADAVVKNLTIEAPSVSGLDEVGVIAGRSAGLIENVTLQNTNTLTPISIISGRSSLGGLVGRSQAGSKIRSSTVGTRIQVNGTGASVGGLVGAGSGLIDTARNQAAVRGTDNIGGIVGQAFSEGSGENAIRNSRNDGAVTGTGLRVGGVAGFSALLIDSSTNYGTVSGNSAVGGIVGRSDANVSYCTNFGNVSGISTVGGIVGNLYAGSISDCEARNAQITGTGIGTNIGGIAGAMNNANALIRDSRVRECQISGGNLVGGVVGHLASGAIRSCRADADIYLTALDSWRSAGGITGSATSAVVENTTYNVPRMIASIGDKARIHDLRCFASSAIIHSCQDGRVDLAQALEGTVTNRACPGGCGGDLTYTCENGEWKHTAGFCSPGASCPITNVPVDYCGTMQMPANRDQATATVSCPGGCSGSVNASCDNGQWKGEFLCDPRKPSCYDLIGAPQSLSAASSWPPAGSNCEEAPAFPLNGCAYTQAYFQLYYTAQRELSFWGNNYCSPLNIFVAGNCIYHFETSTIAYLAPKLSVCEWANLGVQQSQIQSIFNLLSLAGAPRNQVTSSSIGSGRGGSRDYSYLFQEQVYAEWQQQLWTQHYAEKADLLYRQFIAEQTLDWEQLFKPSEPIPPDSSMSVDSLSAKEEIMTPWDNYLERYYEASLSNKEPIVFTTGDNTEVQEWIDLVAENNPITGNNEIDKWIYGLDLPWSETDATELFINTMDSTLGMTFTVGGRSVLLLPANNSNTFVWRSNFHAGNSPTLFPTNAEYISHGINFIIRHESSHTDFPIDNYVAYEESYGSYPYFDFMNFNETRSDAIAGLFAIRDGAITGTDMTEFVHYIARQRDYHAAVDPVHASGEALRSVLDFDPNQVVQWSNDVIVNKGHAIACEFVLGRPC